MKFFAFLKDSYREAVNGWILQAMMLLAFMLVLFIASISFQPQPLKAQMDTSFGLINRVISASPDYQRLGSPKFSVDNFTETNSAEPWKSDYSFDFVVTCPSAEDLQKTKDRGRGAMPVTRPATERMIKASFNFLKDVKVENVKPPEKPAPDAKAADGPAEARFHVTSKGTTITDVREWRHVPWLFFSFDIPPFATSLRGGVYFMEKWLVNGAGAWIALLVSIIVTAGFIPNMLSKGTLDLMVSKPISKTLVLIYKYIGGLIFVLLLTTFTAFSVWLVLGLRVGLWSTQFLLLIPIVTFYFAILYAVSTLVGVFTRNMLVAILATICAWLLFWGIGKMNSIIEDRYEAIAEQLEKEKSPETAKAADKDDEVTLEEVARRIDPDGPILGIIPKSTFIIFQGLHRITPRNFDLDARLGRVIASGVLTDREMKLNDYGKPPRETWAGMIGVSSLFIVFCLGLSAIRMETRDG